MSVELLGVDSQLKLSFSFTVYPTILSYLTFVVLLFLHPLTMVLNFIWQCKYIIKLVKYNSLECYFFSCTSYSVITTDTDGNII